MKYHKKTALKIPMDYPAASYVVSKALMSDQKLSKVARGWKKMIHASQDFGCLLKEPFMALSFLALPVIPELKITDKGLVDVGRLSMYPFSLSDRQHPI